MYSFKVHDAKPIADKMRTVPAETLWANKFTEERFDRASKQVVSHSTGEVVLGCSSGDLISGRTCPNALVAAVGLAYNSHFPLSLSPSAIWLAIAQGFGTWINENAEAVRKQFVSHEGKAKIIIDVPIKPDWNVVLGQFSDQIAAHVGKKRDLFVSDFSTTSLNEKTASEVVLMYGMSKYFDYEMRTLCGFPKITLEGSVEDWERVRDRVRAFSELGTMVNDDHLKLWIPKLMFNLDAFVEAAKGRPDLDFWRKFYNESGGSGGPHLSGHLINFFAYVNNGGKTVKNTFNRLRPSNLDAGISKVDVEWNFFGVIRKVEFHGGFVGVSTAEDSTVRPECGWGIIDVTGVKNGRLD